MAYGLKYQQYVGKGEARVLIQVFVKDWTGRAYEMAHITGASLQIVGGNSDVLTPVIKTAFSWSLVDAWDQGTTQDDGTTCVDALGRKCGQWEEFFTPDATKFKVVVSAAPVGALLRTIWTGYVTPDSWSEDLIYRGSVTITARDMLGSLNEMEFSMEGRPSVLQVVQGALAACACAMPLTYNRDHFLVNSDGANILAHGLGAMTFGGNSWYQALTETLESLGLVLRWNGKNQLVLTSLRYLAEDTQAGYHEMEFINRTGMRELSPALKLVTETFDVAVENLSAPDPAQSDFEDSHLTMTQRQPGTLGTDKPVPKYLLRAPASGGWLGGDTGCGCIPRPTQIYNGCPDRGMYFVPNLTEVYDTIFSTPGILPPMNFTIRQEGPVMHHVSYPTGHLEAGPLSRNLSITGIEVWVSCKTSGNTRYLTQNNGWSSAFASFTIAPGDTVNVPRLDDPSGFAIGIRAVTIANSGIATGDYYVVALTLDLQQSNSEAITMEYKTTTEYDQQNNMRIDRKPRVATVSVPVAIDFCQNVISYNATAAPDEWNWPGEETFYPLAVMIQAQVLCFYSAPASVFTGTAHDGDVALPGYGLRYYGRDCVIVSGTYDFTSGYLSQLNAREVYSWEDVWGEGFAPEYVVKTATTKGGTDATNGWTGGGAAPAGGEFNADEFDNEEFTTS